VAANDAGVCGLPGATGASCASNAECMSPNDCLSGVCTLSGHLGQSCRNHSYCYDGACQVDAGPQGLCVSYRTAGEACGGGLDCASATCVHGVCQPPCP
jgi:hypothetical protein